MERVENQEGPQTGTSPTVGALDEDLERRFMYHSPDGRQARFEVIRDQMLIAASAVHVTVPPGIERSRALVKLEEAMFWANAGIAREER